MRIAELSTYAETCGVATYTEALIGAFEGLGHVVRVIPPSLRPGVQAVGPNVPRYFSHEHATLEEARGVFREIVGFGADVVHVQHNLRLFSARFLAALTFECRRARLPVFVTLHGTDGGSWSRRLRYHRELFAVRGASLIVHNPRHARQLGTRLAHVIPHGVPERRTLPLDIAKQNLGIASERPTLAHFGFITPHKGIAPMLHAVDRLRKGPFPEILYLVGGGTLPAQESTRYLAELRSIAETLGLERHVTLAGTFAPDDRALLELQAGDWVVLNYRTTAGQATSGAARFALSAGRPVATSQVALFDDVRAASYPLSEPLASSLTHMLQAPDLAAEMVRRAERFCQRHAWRTTAERHVALFESSTRLGASSGATP